MGILILVHQPIQMGPERGCEAYGISAGPLEYKNNERKTASHFPKIECWIIGKGNLLGFALTKKHKTAGGNFDIRLWNIINECIHALWSLEESLDDIRYSVSFKSQKPPEPQTTRTSDFPEKTTRTFFKPPELFGI